eukprot:scaffold684_cov345-Pavlova_lutheri.AAC.21
MSEHLWTGWKWCEATRQDPLSLILEGVCSPDRLVSNPVWWGRSEPIERGKGRLVGGMVRKDRERQGGRQGVEWRCDAGPTGRTSKCTRCTGCPR